ncbi:T9SS type A sorting domain-containing protein [Algibacter pectinivorans]|uniref:Por secretion system C-terminal sorting domain-containing protein n=1 Tax=Algibacter pectinivorans TaxID=870482 RepID=A0A1I1N5B2_9FLAO|nr:T9SS type A sorting domain-containing protein [Algibacter pectinivorans]SFC92867.1 Por secretion system C-terminal sorting domain-containing protein [Algibacter pectinivorans]
MIKNLPFRLMFVALIFLMNLTNVYAQVSLKEISLKEQIDNSSLVVEGEVVSQRSFWDEAQEKIYTAYTVNVYKVFKGQFVERVEVVELGGTVGLNAFVVSHGLNLKKGNLGVFTLYDSNYNLKEAKLKQFKIYSAIQGFYKYDRDNNEVANVFGKTNGIESTFYKTLTKLTKTSYKEVRAFKAAKESQKNAGVLMPTGISFPSTPVTSGTKTELVITGSGFGTAIGKVGFRDADEGGAVFTDALDSEVISWSDSEIRVLVPSFAGSGNIRVTDSGGISNTSTNNLTVKYATINAVFQISGENQAFEVQHYDNNGQGGNTWSFYADFYEDVVHTGAKAAYEKALESWRCETGVNWVIDTEESTTSEISDIDSHIIRFDNGNELEAGVLGVTYTAFSGRICGSSVIAYVVDSDMVFDKETNWYFGLEGETLDNGEFDFETVALHELGHAHLLGHVNDISNIMNFEIFNAVINSTLDDNSIEAGNSVHLRSTTNQVCNGNPAIPLMTDYSGSCGLSVEDNIALLNSITIYPNPTENEFYIESPAVNLKKITIYDLGGRLIRQIETIDSSNLVPVSLKGVSKGVYFVNLYSVNLGFVSKKLVLK